MSVFIFPVTDSDIYKKMVEMENLAETRLKAISVLETQKFDLVQGKIYDMILTLYVLSYQLPQSLTIVYGTKSSLRIS